MRWIYATTLAATLITTTFATAPTAVNLTAQDTRAAQGRNGSDELKSAVSQMRALKREMQIMERVLTKALFQRAIGLRNRGVTFQNAAANYQAAQQLAFASTYKYKSSLYSPSHLYLPGYGVLFRLSLQMPVREKVEAVPAPEQKDAWETAQKEIEVKAKAKSNLFEQVQLTTLGKVRKHWIVDDTAVGSAIDVLLTTLGKHAARMEGVPDDENIVIAARLRVRGQATPFLGRAQTNGQMLIVQVAKRYLLQYGERSITLNDVKKKARVTRY